MEQCLPDYKTNFLVEVISRIDFASPIVQILDSLKPEVSKGIMKFFPVSEPKKVPLAEFQFSKNDLMAKKTEAIDWVYFSQDRQKNLSIGPSWIFWDYKRYDGFEQLNTDILGVSRIFQKAYPEAQIRRLGLRYINQIELKDSSAPLDWKDYINENMLCIFKIPKSNESISRAFHILDLLYDNMNVKFQFGMHNPDYPARIRRKTFVLDMDIYLQAYLEWSQVEEKLDIFHRKAIELFEMNIEYKLKELMSE